MPLQQLPQRLRVSRFGGTSEAPETELSTFFWGSNGEKGGLKAKRQSRLLTSTSWILCFFFAWFSRFPVVFLLFASGFSVRQNTKQLPGITVSGTPVVAKSNPA